jgi:hypothetical protein
MPSPGKAGKAEPEAEHHCGEGDGDLDADFRQLQRVAAETIREGPPGLIVRAGGDRAEGADDEQYETAKDQLGQRVAPQSAERAIAAVSALPARLADARRQMESVDRRERDHGREERQLDEEQMAVGGADERRDRADEKPALDDPARQQEGDAGHSEPRETPRRRADDREPSHVGLAAARGE